MTVLVVDHALTFAGLAAQLDAAGWQRDPDPTAPEPLLPGEPEDAEWHDDATRLRYHFEPATGMRALRLSGTRADAAAATLAAQLPCLGSADARALLGSPDAGDRLRGLQMVELLESYELVGDVAGLADDANATVAGRARLIAARLALLASGEAVGWLAQWKRENPDKSAVFLLAGSAAARAQVLRWLAHTRTAGNEHIDAVLRTALDDGDWEVRMTAIVLAGRLRARAVADAVRAARLPQDTADGVNQDERRMLLTFLSCALELMQGADVPPMSREPPDTRERMHAHVLRCIAGEPVAHREKAFLYLTSLLTPLPDAPPPRALPAGIVADGEGGYLLAAHGIALRWVPAVPHWLGEDLPRMRVPNPIRQASSGGFFITRVPLEDGRALTFDAAAAQCRTLSHATGLMVRLPSADEWEMATRGPDGRRFPWGNNARAEWRLGPSPWGVAGAVGRRSEWTATRHGETALVCGGEDLWVCAMRAPATRDSSHALRAVIEMVGVRGFEPPTPTSRT
jgi:hypothetical protein